MKELTEKVIGAAIEVYRTIGPGLLESAYEDCLAHGLGLHGLEFERQDSLPVNYEGVTLDYAYRLGSIVGKQVVADFKTVDVLQPIHKAQVLTHLKLGGWTVRLLLNFVVPVLKDGIKHLVLGYKDSPASSVSPR